MTRNTDDSGTRFGSIDRRTLLRVSASVGGVSLAGCLDSLTGDGGGGGGGEEISGPIKIGAMGPADDPYGASILNSAELAATEINDEGGIEGNDVEIITKDTKDDPGTATTVYEELTTGENVDFTIGIFGSEQLLAILSNVAQQETLHLSTGAATPEATQKVSEEYEEFKYYFRVGPTNSHFLGESLIEFANDKFSEMGWETVGVLIEDYKWTEPIQTVFDEQLGDVSSEVAVEKVVPEGTEDFTPIYDEMANAGIDGCYTVLAHIGSTSLTQWAQQQRPFGYGGNHVPAQLPSFYEATNGAARYTFSQNTATPNTEITEKTVPYADAYNQEFGQYPVYDGYIAYDAIYLLKEAIEEAQTTNSEDLVPVLEKVNQDGIEFTGAAGITEFFPKDHEYAHDLKYNSNTKGIYFQWQQDGDTGTQNVIWAGGKDVETVEYQTPSWI